MNRCTLHALRPALLGRIATLCLLLIVTIAASACSLPGQAAPPTTGSSAARTAPPPSPTATVTPTPRSPATATATPSPSPRAARATARPGSFRATADKPCREMDFNSNPLSAKKTTVSTVEQAYRCLSLHWVDRQRLDHRVLLDGAWSGLEAAGGGHFQADDLAPLGLVNDRESDWTTFAERFSALSTKYSRTVDGSVLARVAIDAMASSLGDNHVFYLEPRLWQRSFAQSIGLEAVTGPGFEVALDQTSGKFYLYRVYPNSPAARAGLRAGDIIEQVGGRPVSKGHENKALADLLTGPAGTGNMVQVTRPANGQTLKLLMQVEEFRAPLIESRVLTQDGAAVLPGKVGYIKLRHFSANAGQEFDRALAGLQRQGITALVFDVRQNPGGSIAALTHILSHFTHQGPLAIMIDEDGEREEVSPNPRVPLLGLPFAVLCDGDSASSADITAAVAKDRGGYLVGERSAGALGAALYFELEDGSALEITVRRVLGPDGEEINEIGVTPDAVVRLTPADLSANNDPQLRQAITYLTGR